jgi:hypothetical protein
MARKLRVQYPGAIYYVMNRGDRREDIFADDQDRRFVETLAETCQKTNSCKPMQPCPLSWIADRLKIGSRGYLTWLLQTTEKPEGTRTYMTIPLTDPDSFWAQQGHQEFSSAMLDASGNGQLWIIAGTVITVSQIQAGFFSYPDDLSYLGTGSGTYAGKPTLENFAGVALDISMGADVLAGGLAPLPSANKSLVRPRPCPLKPVAEGESSFSRFFYDDRPFRTISREYWDANGPADGSSLHHWLFPQRADWVPQGIRNAGFNLMELPPVVDTAFGGLNQWMGMSRSPLAPVVDWGIRIGVPASIAGAAYGGAQLGNSLFGNSNSGH